MAHRGATPTKHQPTVRTSRKAYARSISLRCCGDKEASNLVERIQPNQPRLRDLEIHCVNPGHDDDDDDDDDSQNGSESNDMDDWLSIKTVPIREAPALVSVVLHNCVLPWSATNLFSGLTYLEIHADAPFSNPKQRPTHAQLRRLLTSMPELEELHLDNIFPNYAPNAVVKPINLPTSCETITLRSRLEMWGLVGPRDGHLECCELADSFVLPPGAVLTVIQNSLGNIGRVLGRFSGSHSRPDAIAIGAGDSDYCGSIVVSLEEDSWFESPVDLLSSNYGAHATFLFEYERTSSQSYDDQGSGDPDPSYERMLEAMRAMDLTALRVLLIEAIGVGGMQELMEVRPAFDSLDGRRHFPARAPLLAQARDVEVLVLPRAPGSDSMDGLDDFLQALIVPFDVTGEYLLPRLRKIVLLWNPAMHGNRNSIINFFRARRRVGLPVEALQVLQVAGRVERWEGLKGIAQVERYHYVEDSDASDSGYSS